MNGAQPAGEAKPPWPHMLLDSVAKRGSGHTPDKKRPEYWNGAVKWLSLKDSDRLDNRYVTDTAEKITPAGLANSSAVEHPAGTVVLTRDAGVGKSAITQDVMAVSQHFMAWLCGSRLDNHFLYYWLQYKKPEFERIAIGNTIKTIGLPYFKALEVPLPSIAEQKAIAKVLGGVDALLSAVDHLIAKQRDLKQGVMHELLTGRTRLAGFSAKWRATTLGNLGLMAKGKGIRKNDVRAEGLPCLRYGEIYTRHHDIVRQLCSFITPEVAGTSKRMLSGDIVFAGSGETAAEIGKCVAFLGNGNEEAYVGGDTIVLQPTGQDSTFLGYFLNQPSVARQKARMAQGDAVVHISARNLATLVITIPELNEQVAIAEVVSDMDAEIAALEQRRDKTRLLKQGMMQELLTGRTRLI